MTIDRDRREHDRTRAFIETVMKTGVGLGKEFRTVHDRFARVEQVVGIDRARRRRSHTLRPLAAARVARSVISVGKIGFAARNDGIIAAQERDRDRCDAPTGLFEIRIGRVIADEARNHRVFRAIDLRFNEDRAEPIECVGYCRCDRREGRALFSREDVRPWYAPHMTPTVLPSRGSGIANADSTPSLMPNGCASAESGYASSIKTGAPDRKLVPIMP